MTKKAFEGQAVSSRKCGNSRSPHWGKLQRGKQGAEGLFPQPAGVSSADRRWRQTRLIGLDRVMILCDSRAETGRIRWLAGCAGGEMSRDYLTMAGSAA